MNLIKKKPQVNLQNLAIGDPELKIHHRGDRKDAVWLRDMDSLHIILPLIYPNRADNEAFIQERLDLTEVNKYLEKKNAAREARGDEFKYTLFHVLVAAMLKTAVQRPKLNRFICDGKIYMRRELSAAFVVKKEMSDHSEEGLAFINIELEDSFESIHEKLRAIIYPIKKGEGDEGTDAMDVFKALPFPVTKTLVAGARVMDRKGLLPDFFTQGDPNYSSVFFTNLGSIKLRSGYHHLSNYGTNSVFVIVGEKKMRPFYDDKGKVTMKDTVDIGLTIDERIADGYYYAKSVDLLKQIIANPEVLDEPLKAEIK